MLATICYIDNGKEFLLLHRNKKPNDVHRGKWISVGGKLEKGESPEDCAKREVFEETGLVVEEMTLCGIVTFPDFTPDTDWYTYVFKVTAFTGQLLEDCAEGTLEWVPYEQVLQKPTWEGDYEMFKWILNDEPFFSAKMTYEDKVLKESQVVFYTKK